MADEPKTRTGRRVPELVADAEADWAHVSGLLTEARDYLGAIEREARGVNGMAATARGCRSTLDQVLGAIEKEAGELRKKMTGPPMADEIQSHVDEEHASRVREARRAS